MKKYFFLFLFCSFCLGIKSQVFRKTDHGWRHEKRKPIEQFPGYQKQMCENLGGNEEFKRFLSFHMVYPPVSMSQKIEGDVVIRYYCDKEGKVKVFKVVDGLAPALDSEAVRLFRLLLWSPAIITNETESTAVDCDNTITFPFHISKYNKWNKNRDKADPNLDRLPLDTSGNIYTQVDKQAAYVRGQKAFVEYLSEEFSYPDEAKAKGLEGKVIVGFVVETDGFVSNMKIKQSLGGGCDTEAVRLMGPTKWKPAQKDGMLVRSYVSYPITFKLDSQLHENAVGGQNQGANGN
jgi:TonB family protein